MPVHTAATSHFAPQITPTSRPKPSELFGRPVDTPEYWQRYWEENPIRSRFAPQIHYPTHPPNFHTYPEQGLTNRPEESALARLASENTSNAITTNAKAFSGRQTKTGPGILSASPVLSGNYSSSISSRPSSRALYSTRNTTPTAQSSITSPSSTSVAASFKSAVSSSRHLPT